MEKSIKSFLLKVEIKGRGCVNYDKSDCHQTNSYYWQKYGAKMLKKDGEYVDNIMFCKKVYETITDENGKTTTVVKPKISKDSLRHAIFEDMCYSHNNGYECDERVRKIYALSIHSLLRGYMMVAKSKYSYGKKTAVNITDAIATNSPAINLEIGTRVCDRSNDDNNSLFYVENFGDVEYLSIGSIDLKQLQFLSTDHIYGRMGADPSWFEGEAPDGKRILDANFGGVDSGKFGFFAPVGCINDVVYAEQGYCFNEECVKTLVETFLKCLMSVRIQRRNNYAEVDRIKIKPVYDALIDRMDDESGWIELTNGEEINSFVNDVISPSHFYDFYSEVTNEDRKNFLNHIEELKGKETPSETAEGSGDEAKKSKKKKKSVDNDNEQSE